LAARHAFAIGLFWWGVLGLCYLVYQPGLSGAFVFDDFPNLRPLGHIGSVTSWEEVRYYLASGFSGPTGRPVSLLTFLIDAHAWPADAEPFKRTNILIHLLNGSLLFWLCIKLFAIGRALEGRALAQAFAALFVAALWMLHPFLVSTTLYVVQRMAQLATLFCIAGLLGYLAARPMVMHKPRVAYLWMTVSLGIGTILATFSKENGALLPVLVLVVEMALVRRAGWAPLNRWWVFGCLVLPAAAILLYLAKVPWRMGLFEQYPGRDFTVFERLITQPRIVLGYLRDWVIPKAFTTGVFHDDVIPSRSLLAPLSTILSMVAVALLLWSAWWSRKRFCWWNLAVLFFFASLLIESTTIGLELKFEHRAYLGSIFLFVPLVIFLMERLSEWRVSAVLGAILLVLAFFSYQGARLWGEYPAMIAVWAVKSPDSPRAQRELARWLYVSGDRDASVRLIDNASERMPREFGLRVTQIMLHCRMAEARDADKDAVIAIAREGFYQKTEFNLMGSLFDWAIDDDCRGLDAAYYEQVIRGFMGHPRNQRVSSLEYAQLTHLLGRTLLQQGRSLEAEEAFDLSLAARKDAHKLMNIAMQFAIKGDFARATFYAEQARDIVALGGLRGIDAATAPRLTDIDYFLIQVAGEEHGKVDGVNE
jgi:protein O-mannosyl-transferase